MNYIPSIAVSLFDRAEKATSRGDTINVILLCMASLEAFINEYIEFGNTQLQDYEKLKNQPKKPNQFVVIIPPFMDIEKELILELSEYEKTRKRLDEKINLIRLKCNGDSWNKGEKTFQDFCTLIKIRNALVHPRSKNVEYGENYIPKFLKPFQNTKIEYFNKINRRMPWIELIETKAFSEWCLNAFIKFMKELLDIMKKMKTSPCNHDESEYSPRHLNFAKEYIEFYNFK